MKKFLICLPWCLLLGFNVYLFLKDIALNSDRFFKDLNSYLACIGWLAIAVVSAIATEKIFPDKGHYGFLFILIGLPAILVSIIVFFKNVVL